jgi:hypothetical protein
MPDQTPCPKSPTGAHHFVCDPAPGATSKGICKYCPAEKTFLNSWTREAEGEEEDMTLTAAEKAKKHKYYEKHRPEIIQCYEEAGGSISKAAKLCTERLGQTMPPTTLNDLIKKRWKIPKPKPVRKKKGHKEPAPEPDEPTAEQREQGLDWVFPHPWSREPWKLVSVPAAITGKLVSMDSTEEKIIATLEVPLQEMERLHMGDIHFYYERQM